ncbi:MAG: relaxase/mobilization nuclease domain-containing protein, partial [Maribacter sp.]
MIARILYRETVQGVLNYVFGKENRMILGFQNTYSEFDTDHRLFGNILYGLGQRKKSTKRYAHITLNLPHGEHLENTSFYEVAKEYMEQMGYGEQPYVVVRHDDTKHEHIHIVSTTVKDDGSSINLSHDFRRNLATQKFIEKTFGLSPAPETRSERQLPLHRLPELQFSTDDGNGNRFYLQEVLNSTFQKYNIRSIDELKILLEPYHIIIKQSVNENGRVGVAYGLNNQKQYKTRFINGYQVHPKLSGPKIKAVFERNRKSKLLPMHKKRLEKQLATTMKLFDRIHYRDFPDILKSYQNIDCELIYDRKQKLIGLTLYDKSGYVFNQAEIGLGIDFTNHPNLSTIEKVQTYINPQSDQFVLEVQKLIKNSFIESYLASDKRNHLLSEFVMTKNLKDLLPHIANSKSYAFLNFYSGKKNNQVLLKTLRQEFDEARNKLAASQSKQEIKDLEEKVNLFEKVMQISVFENNEDSNIRFHLLHSLGLKYANGGLS